MRSSTSQRPRRSSPSPACRPVGLAPIEDALDIRFVSKSAAQGPKEMVVAASDNEQFSRHYAFSVCGARATPPAGARRCRAVMRPRSPRCTPLQHHAPRSVTSTGELHADAVPTGELRLRPRILGETSFVRYRWSRTFTVVALSRMRVTMWPMSVDVSRHQWRTSVPRLFQVRKRRAMRTSRRHSFECRARVSDFRLARLRGRLVSPSAHHGTPVDPPLSGDNRCGFGRFCGEFAAFHMIDVCVFARNYSTYACLSVPSAVCSLCRADVDAMTAVKPHSPT